MVNFECKNCKKKFTNKRNLTNHLHKKVCANEKDFSCAICGLEYKKRWNLRCHIATHGIEKEDISNYIINNKKRKKKWKKYQRVPFVKRNFLL